MLFWIVVGGMWVAVIAFRLLAAHDRARRVKPAAPAPVPVAAPAKPFPFPVWLPLALVFLVGGLLCLIGGK